MPILTPSGYPQTSGNRTRSQVRAEMADYLGGGNKPDVQASIDAAWHSAIREFNAVGWSFNRVTADITMSSNMKNNAAAPTISRDAGVGIGFTLDAGTILYYWIEERVKVGNQIIRRNFAPVSTVVQLTGDGTNDKPVITRPTQVNADATHWCLFSTGLSQTAGPNAWPDGAELAEAPIATTTIEDLRIGNNVAIPGPNNPSGATGLIYRSGFSDLPTNFRMPIKCHLLDEQGRERISLVYIPYRQYAIFLSRVATASRPLFYTLRNRFGQGQAIFHPRPAAQILWPTARVIYDSPIIIPGGSPDAVLQVPQEMDEAIFQRATAIFIQRKKGPEAAAGLPAANELFQLRLDLEAEYRDFEDS